MSVHPLASSLPKINRGLVHVVINCWAIDVCVKNSIGSGASWKLQCLHVDDLARTVSGMRRRKFRGAAEWVVGADVVDALAGAIVGHAWAVIRAALRAVSSRGM